MSPAHLPSPHPTTSFWQTPPSPFLLHHRSTPVLPREADVIIIGSGITGAFAAKSLRETGIHNVVMLEAREACSAATGRNGGHCQPVFYGKSVSIAEFEAMNFDAIEALIKENDISCEWRQVIGGCHAFFSEEVFEAAKAEVVTLRKESPMLARLVDAIDDKDVLKSLKVRNAVGAVVQLGAASLSPYKLISWILEHLIKDRALNLQTNTPALSISKSANHSWSVNTPRGSVRASHVLVATNGYSSHLLPQFSSLIVPVQGEMSALTPPESVRHHALDYSYAFVGEHFKDDYLVQRPMSLGGQLMFGGGRTYAENSGVNTDGDDFNDPAVAKYLKSTLGHYLDILDNDERPEKQSYSGVEGPREQSDSNDATNGSTELTAEAEWTGVMGFSRDNVPWLGGVPDMDGVWLCAGYTGHGMPSAPLSALHVVNLLRGASNGEDWRERERLAVKKKEVPEQYVISRERMERAMELEEVNGSRWYTAH